MRTNYSGTQCPKCENTSFELVEDTPRESSFKMMFVRCCSCNTAVGIVDYYNAGYLVKQLAEKLNVEI